jgi:hypothetical protein
MTNTTVTLVCYQGRMLVGTCSPMSSQMDRFEVPIMETNPEFSRYERPSDMDRHSHIRYKIFNFLNFYTTERLDYPEGGPEHYRGPVPCITQTMRDFSRMEYVTTFRYVMLDVRDMSDAKYVPDFQPLAPPLFGLAVDGEDMRKADTLVELDMARRTKDTLQMALAKLGTSVKLSDLLDQETLKKLSAVGFEAKDIRLDVPKPAPHRIVEL